ncbi:lysylphosphatidylglycerol synthase transmembrane domain-containing protein [Ottowia caeni]|uniref:lysylphosphatidylglycerol synthase transmembrane domain-containing protein n=1 Tax=Ottowia caeni TaxID=2870339 RepID=UPI001E612AB6|nr:flippase-like domain-containing protein [Ottowia caeni]
MKRPRKALLRGLLGLALLGIVLALADPARVMTTFRQANPGWLLFGLAAGIASNAISALRWRALARWLGTELSPRDAQRWYFQSMGLNALLPGAVVGGDVYRAVMLRKAGQNALASTWSVILDRASGLWMLCVIGGFGVVLCAGVLGAVTHLAPAWLAALALAATLAWLVLPWLLPRVLRLFPGRRGGWFDPLRAVADRPDFAAQVATQALMSAVVQILSATALAAGALALGVRLSPAVWAFAVAPIFLMAALPVSVGGWGTREAAAVASLAPFGVAPAAAVGAAMIYGLYGLLQGALGALAFGLPSSQSSESAPFP